MPVPFFSQEEGLQEIAMKYYLVVLLAWAFQNSGFADSNQIHFPVERQNQASHGIYLKAFQGMIFVPESVVSYVEKITGTKPTESDSTSWGIRMSTFPIQGSSNPKEIVWIIPSFHVRPEKNKFSRIPFQAGQNEWIRLNTIDSLPNISYLLQFNWSEHTNPFRFNDFMAGLSAMFTGYLATPLTNAFLKTNDIMLPNLNVSGLTDWTKLDPTKVPYLRSLCGEKIEQTGTEVTISVHAINRAGAVEHWLIRGRQSKYFEIFDVKVEEICPPDTFGYAVSGV